MQGPGQVETPRVLPPARSLALSHRCRLQKCPMASPARVLLSSGAGPAAEKGRANSKRKQTNKKKSKKKKNNKASFQFCEEHPKWRPACCLHGSGVEGRALPLPGVVSVCPAALAVAGWPRARGCRRGAMLCAVSVRFSVLWVAGRCCILALHICPACPNRF